MTEQAVALRAETAPTLTPPTETSAIIHMIERAARDPAVDIDKMERLLAMHDRVLAREAKAAYSSALSAMQTELPVISERGRIDIGRGKPQTYALWEDINEKIKPVLSKHGFALSFRTGQTESKITVTGILSHKDGHSEETTMHLPIDNSGSKNAVQAVGSSTSYGKRYTAAALLNLTSRGEDDDGQAGGAGVKITEEQMTELVDLCEATGSDRTKFCKYLKVASLADLPASRFNDAKAALEAKKQS